MGECKINIVHSENSDAKAHVLKMCLPASSLLSVQKVLGQRNVHWFSSCKIRLSECSLIQRHFCKSFEQFQIWSGVWPLIRALHIILGQPKFKTVIMGHQLSLWL